MFGVISLYRVHFSNLPLKRTYSVQSHEDDQVCSHHKLYTLPPLPPRGLISYSDTSSCPFAMRTFSQDGLHPGCCVFLYRHAYPLFIYCTLLHEYPTEDYPWWEPRQKLSQTLISAEGPRSNTSLASMQDQNLTAVFATYSSSISNN